MTPTRETIARAIYQAAHGTMTDAEWADVWTTFPDNFAPRAAAVLRALDEAGLVVVPKEASEAMLAAAGDAFLSAVVDHVPGDMPGASAPFRRIYRAMIAAAPDVVE